MLTHGELLQFVESRGRVGYDEAFKVLYRRSPEGFEPSSFEACAARLIKAGFLRLVEQEGKIFLEFVAGSPAE
jgi:hypothetical protein